MDQSRNEETKERRIRYGFKIDQSALWGAGVRNVDYIDLSIYEFICGMLQPRKTKKLIHDDQVFVLVYSSAIIEQMPYLSRKGRMSKEAVSDRITNLVDAGLLVRHPDNQRMGKTYYSPSDLASSLTETLVFDDDFETDTSVEFNQGGRLNSTKGSVEFNQGVGGIQPTLTTKKETTQKELREKEARAQEIAKGKPNPSPQLPKQPDQKTLQPQPPRISTRDIPFCEGHGFKIYANEYPEQSKGVPFCHPSIVLERIPLASRLDLWWRLYGVNVGKGKCEMRLMQANMGDDANFAALYLHTYLYVVANPDKEFRAKPEHYLRDRAWLDDIIDRRKDKPDAPPAGVHDPKDPTNRPRNPEAEARAWERQQAKEADAEWLRKNPPKTT